MRVVERVCLPGPLHPDMFDGEAPIMEPVAKLPRVYEVAVSYTVCERNTLRLFVAASSEREARAIGLAEVEASASDDEGDFEVEGARVVERAPREDELAAWRARRLGEKQ